MPEMEGGKTLSIVYDKAKKSAEQTAAQTSTEEVDGAAELEEDDNEDSDSD